MPTNTSPKLSLVIPCYNEEENLGWLVPKLVTYLDDHNWTYEIIFVNDGSIDNSEAKLQELQRTNSHLRYLSFSRNFGKEAATTAGIHTAKGQAVIIIDADGQHPIELISKFVDAWENGSEVVIGVRRSNQREGIIKRYGSKLFYRVLNLITEGNSVSGSTDFRLIDRKVANAFNQLTEHNRITRGLIDWLGFRRSYIAFDADARVNGVAAYNYKKLVKLALHAFVAQSTKPLLFTGAAGIFVMAVSAVLGIFMVTEQYLLADPLSLNITATAILAVFLTCLVGFVLSCQGLLALYIESIHSETQNRPLYIVRDED